MTYSAVEVTVDEKQNEKLTDAIKENKPLSVKVIISNQLSKKSVLFTPSQIKKIERARLIGRNSISIRMSRKQVQANTQHKGGFIWGLISRLAPAILGGIASGLASKAVSGKGVYCQKGNICAEVKPVKAGGLYLSPHPHLRTQGDGIYVCDGVGVRKEGRGLLLGENSPFKNIPLLGLLL